MPDGAHDLLFAFWTRSNVYGCVSLRTFRFSCAVFIDVWRKRRPKSPIQKERKKEMPTSHAFCAACFIYFFADEILGDSVGGDILTEPPQTPHPL